MNNNVKLALALIALMVLIEEIRQTREALYYAATIAEHLRQQPSDAD